MAREKPRKAREEGCGKRGGRRAKAKKAEKGSAEAPSQHKFGRELRAAKRGAEALSHNKFESKPRSG